MVNQNYLNDRCWFVISMEPNARHCFLLLLVTPSCLIYFLPALSDLWISSRQYGEQLDFNYTLKSSQPTQPCNLTPCHCDTISVLPHNPPHTNTFSWTGVALIQLFSYLPNNTNTILSCNCLRRLTQPISSLWAWLSPTTYNYRPPLTLCPAPNSS